ncbi:MAG: long-chain fatty acid--CoA ligase [Chloroflexi bacterium]|nr:MAG: long-chain fatty acid--CoA ligase [Chloroflexota bacterium]
MDVRAQTFAWGTEVRRGDGPIPFLQYSPRRHHVSEFIEDAERWRDRVHLVQGSRRLTFGKVFEAWIRAGALLALGNGWWSRRETEHAINLLQPSIVIADEKRRELLPEDQRHVVDVDAIRKWTESAPPAGVPTRAASGPTSPVNGEENDPAVIVFTAGTTGDPKAAVLAHRSVIANLHSLLLVSGRLPQQLDPAKLGAVILQSGPMFHIGGIQALLLAMLCGHTVVFLEGRFDAGQVLDVIERERVTVWGAVPTMASRVLDHPSLPSRDLSGVRSISLGGAAVQPELTARLRLAFTGAGRGLSTIYGMTETGGTVASASGELMAEHPRTSGKPTPVSEIRIGSPDAEGAGEILVRTPGQMLGYWGHADAGIIDTDGWVHTGDLGRFEDGLLYVTGRSKDIIIRGGENIASAHVESALLRHPAVRNVAVVARPDPDLGERVGAAIQLDPAELLSAEMLAEFARTQLPNHEVPTDWWILTDELPMTDAGKVDKRKLNASWPS